MKIENKRVVITGGSSGLGKALAEALVLQGAQVAIVARDSVKLEAMQVAHPQLLRFVADISDKQAIYPLAGALHSALGEIDWVFNVASTLGPTPLRSLMDTACEDLEQVLATNLIGPFRLSKALLPSMILRGQGLVVNISSDAAVQAYPHWGAYGVSKAALDHLTRIWQAELGEQGVQFLALDPGDMNTPMHFAAIPDADPSQLRRPEDSAAAILALLNNQDFASIRRSV